MSSEQAWHHFDIAVDFIQQIGIGISFEPNSEPAIMPGICIRGGKIIVDKANLLYPGDVLHEAGHIAVVPEGERSSLNNDTIARRPMAPAEEMMAIAWSYAACVHLGLPSSFVFHDHGYHGGGKSLRENFDGGYYFGVPMLQYLGLCSRAGQSEQSQYPVMLHWVLQAQQQQTA